MKTSREDKKGGEDRNDCLRLTVTRAVSGRIGHEYRQGGDNAASVLIRCIFVPLSIRHLLDVTCREVPLMVSTSAMRRVLATLTVVAVSGAVALGLAPLPAAASDGESFRPVQEWLPDIPAVDENSTRYVVNDSTFEGGLMQGGSYLAGEVRNPLPGNPNNIDSYYCASYDDADCRSRAVFFFNQLPPCDAATTWNCIDSLRVSKEGSEQQASLARVLDFTGPLNQSLVGPTPWGTENTGVHSVPTFAGDRSRDLPPGGTVSMWTLPGLASDSFLAVSVSLKGDTHNGGSVPRMQGFYAGVIPVIARPISQPFAPAYVSVRDQDGHVGVGGVGSAGPECAFVDATYCYVRAEYPSGVRITLTAHLTNTLSGWLHGRLVDPAIDITTLDSRTNRVEISGDVASVPVTFKDFLTKDLPPDLRFNPPVWYQLDQPWRGVWNLFADGEFRLDWFERVMPLLDDRAAATVGAWAVRAVVGFELPPCLRSTSELLGMVTTSAMMYNGGAPRFVDGRLTYRVAGLHLDPDGSVERGSYSLVMRSSAARCLYGFSDAPVVADISVVSEDGSEQVATTAVSESEGWLRLTAENFTFSAPTISIGLSQQAPTKIKFICLKVNRKIAGPKRIVVNGVAGDALKCPKGYRKK